MNAINESSIVFYQYEFTIVSNSSKRSLYINENYYSPLYHEPWIIAPPVPL